MATLERVVGCIVGAGVGDALAERAGPSGGPVIVEGTMHWTAHTQRMKASAYSLLKALRDPGDPSALGHAVEEEMLAWYHDPTSAERGAGGSSLEAARKLLTGATWRHSGNPRSDGAEAAIAAIPVGLIHPAKHVPTPAILCTMVSHKHDNALQSAVITAWLISSLVRGAPLDAALVMEARDVGVDLIPSGRVGRSLTDALVEARRLDTHDGPIDPAHIKPRDGGERSGSALGLAIVLSLRAAKIGTWQAMEQALGTAAQLGSGAGPVATLTGAILGATMGIGGVPRHLIEHTEAHDRLIELGRALHLFANRLDRNAPATTHEVDTQRGYTTVSPESIVPGFGGAPRHGEATDTEQQTIDDLNAPAAPEPEPQAPSTDGSTDDSTDDDDPRPVW